MAATLAAADLSERFSLCLLDVCKHLRHCASAEEFTWSVFDDVENQAMVGLVIHSLRRHHYVALVRNGEQFPSQMLLLDSLRPEEVEVVTAHTFKSIIAGEEADGKYAAQSGYTVLQCVRGRLHERFTDAFLATPVRIMQGSWFDQIYTTMCSSTSACLPLPSGAWCSGTIVLTVCICTGHGAFCFLFEVAWEPVWFLTWQGS